MTQEIATDLNIHERTVKLHRSAIMTKLKAGSVANSMRICIKDLGDREPPRAA